MTAAASKTDLFPRWFPWQLFFLTLVSRVYYVTQPHNWWILHPDEIYQSLEVAHGEMYGYGFRPYEYMPPDRTPDLPNIRHQELDHGMAALRSFLVPRAYVMVTWLLELLGVSFTPFVAWKVAHAFVSSTLPLAVYRYVIAVFRSHDTACLAAVFCAVCTHLYVLGTHTLVNSLLAPPVFFALAHLHNRMTSSTDKSELNEKGQNGESVKNGHCSDSGTLKKFGSSRRKLSPKAKGNHVHKNGQASQYHRDENFNIKKSFANGDSCHTQGKTTPGKNGKHAQRNGHAATNGKIHNNDMNGDLHKNLVANGVRQPGTSHVSNAQSDWTSFSFCHARGMIISFMSNVTAGFVLGVCCYIRTDLAALVITTPLLLVLDVIFTSWTRSFNLQQLLPSWRPLRKLFGDAIVSAFGVLLGVGLGVWEDFRCYGWGVVTPLNWYRFNVENDYSTAFFGQSSWDTYFFGIFFQNYGTVVLTFASVVCAAVTVFRGSKQTKSSGRTLNDLGTVQTENATSWLVPAAGVTVAWGFLLLLYSSKGHKELRFVHNVIVLVMVTCAAALNEGLARLAVARSVKLSILFVGVVCFALSQWHDVTHLQENHGLKGNRLAFKQAGDTQDVNVCLHYLSSQNDVTGVFIDRNLYATAGYTILHKNVSIFTIFNNNFHEYSVDDRLVHTSRSLIGPQRNVSVAYLSHLSNYVYSKNAQYAMKFVLEDPRYNYLVLLKERDLLQFGFGQPVFQYGAFKVLRRQNDPEVLAAQARLAANLMPVQNATILLHEADKLLWHGVWARAAERFKDTLRVDPGVVAAYSPLAYCLKELGDFRGFESTLLQCYHQFGPEECEKVRGLVKLK
ncbi:hypothetical protein BaRGS_00034325 [Batillaria attramentaria]|uniref:Mannosyltransferase n=1 Tax=Batillaria attramentaria TaxID=370345 RepID=A0ABD0JHH5_9CAEN